MAQDSNNIPAGLNIITQIPLNIKENILNEATLAYLGISNNLAFTYHDQLVVTCLIEGTRYIWREVQVGEENTGLVPLDFTYPPNIIVYGITYSNKKFNFFKLPDLNSSYNVTNIGAGVGLYKNTTVLNDLKTFNFKEVISDTLTITDDGDNVRFELPSSEAVLRFIVNSDYTGIEQLGTETKPFKNLQNALDAYVGNGVSNKAPQFLGYRILVQKDTNLFTGSLAYKDLMIEIQSGASIYTTPSVGEYSTDLDSEAVLPININYSMLPFTDTEPCFIQIVNNGSLILNKQGFKNRGTTSVSLGYKLINISGTGTLILSPDVNVGSPSVRKIFSANEDNQTGFTNPGAAQFLISLRKIEIPNSQFAVIGKNSQLYLGDSDVTLGSTTSSFNENTVPIVLNGGTVDIIESGGNAKFQNYYNTISNGLVNWISMKTEGGVGAIFRATNSRIGNNCDYVFLNKDTEATTSCGLTLINCEFLGEVSEAYIKSNMVGGAWAVRLINNFINQWGVDSSKVILVGDFLNSLGGRIVETLTEYSSKGSAILAGLFKGCSFIKTTIKTAGTFVTDQEYKITTIGTTDFTLIGASANTVGLYFTATGVGTGTGTATNYSRDTII